MVYPLNTKDTYIKTDRLVIGKPCKDDIPDLVSLLGNWNVSKWLSSVPYPYEESDASDWLDIMAQDIYAYNIFLNDLIIGGIGLMDITKTDAEVGYWIGEEYWGNGYASEALAALIQHVFRTMPITALYASYFEKNTASAKLLRKTGFKEIGKHTVYSASRNEMVQCIKLVLTQDAAMINTD